MRDVVERLLAPAKDRVDERPPDAPIAVDERVDVLELGMGDRRLRHGRQIVAKDEQAGVLKQGRDRLGRRRDVRGADRVEVVAADPVLHVPDDAGDLSIRGQEPSSRR